MEDRVSETFFGMVYRIELHKFSYAICIDLLLQF